MLAGLALSLADGTELLVRPVRPEDVPLVVEHHGRLSKESIRMRYFSMVKDLTHERLIRLCHLDYHREMALAAVHADEHGPQIWSISRHYLDVECASAEFSVTVADPYLGLGLGTHLMQRLVEVARHRGVRRLAGLVLLENRRVLELIGELGFRAKPTDDPNIVEAELAL